MSLSVDWWWTQKGLGAWPSCSTLRGQGAQVQVTRGPHLSCHAASDTCDKGQLFDVMQMGRCLHRSRSHFPHLVLWIAPCRKIDHHCSGIRDLCHDGRRRPSHVCIRPCRSGLRGPGDS